MPIIAVSLTIRILLRADTPDLVLESDAQIPPPGKKLNTSPAPLPAT
jgi:hypothetical protein